MTQQTEPQWDATGIEPNINDYWRTFSKSDNAEGLGWHRTNPKTLVDVTLNHRTGRLGDKSYWAVNCSWGVNPAQPTIYLADGREVRNKLKARPKTRTVSTFEQALNAAVMLEGFWQSWLPEQNRRMGKKDWDFEGEKLIDWQPFDSVPVMLQGDLDPALVPDLNDGFAPAQPTQVPAPQQPTQVPAPQQPTQVPAPQQPTQVQVPASTPQGGQWMPDGTQRGYFNR